MNTKTGNESVLRTLRALVPQRRLSYFESLRIAELQANRMLELFEIEGPLVPSELITELPRVQVRVEDDLPVSGSTHWENGKWVITLNGSEPVARQRFSLMHEFKHAVDHTTRDFLYGHADDDAVASARAERAADHFAACVLMPKRWIKSQWASTQQVSVLSRRLGVSSRALSVRLYHLGMAGETPRCARTTTANAWPSRIRGYLRRTAQFTETSP
jgi:hypothetical protein